MTAIEVVAIVAAVLVIFVLWRMQQHVEKTQEHILQGMRIFDARLRRLEKQCPNCGRRHGDTTAGNHYCQSCKERFAASGYLKSYIDNDGNLR